MSFFILTGAILLGTVFIVHFAANALGFRLFYTSLFLSAVLALAINLVVISMKDVTSPISIAKIALIVLFASAFATVVNDVLTRYEIKKLQKRRARRKEAAAEEFAEDAKDIDEVEEITDFEENSSDDDNSESGDEEKILPKKEGFFKKLLNKFSFSGFKKKSEKSNENLEIVDTVEESPIIEPVKEDIENKVEEITETEQTKAEINENVSSESVKETEEQPKSDGFFKKLFKKSEPPREKIDISGFADLDAVLDFAYDAKISGRYLDAVDAYEGAIEKYENDPYLPFLFIDLGNVHKAQGEYNAAIDVYEKAVNMPNIQKDLNILKSFEENIDYLKALKIVLRKHKAEHKPFSEIDEAILKEVENNLNK